MIALQRWLQGYLRGLGCKMQLSYLPPMMVYAASGASGLTAIVGTFYVKERLGLSAGALAGLAFWTGVPWAFKVPLGHLVDLIWRWKAVLVFVGAGLICASILIMIGLLGELDAMRRLASIDAWFVLSALLAPLGYVLQDTVADAMTVEAVPRSDEHGEPLPDAELRAMHTTVQTLGRAAVIAGSLLVATANVWLLRDAPQLAPEALAGLYVFVYKLALIIPVVSVLGVVLNIGLRGQRAARLRSCGHAEHQVAAMLDVRPAALAPNWWILGGGLAFALLFIGVGLSEAPAKQEIVFVSCMGVVLFLIWRLAYELAPEARAALVGTAVVVFAFRAVPSPGLGATWWMIDELGFDQEFMATLSFMSSVFGLSGLFIFRRYMAERSIVCMVGMLTIAGTLLSLPILGMFYGLHEWTASITGGLVGARTIAIIDTGLASPFGQVAMVPMLAWIANSAPERLKATFFAVMASFGNLASSASELGTKYLNQIFVVERGRPAVAGQVPVPGDYSELGMLLAFSLLLGLALPMLAVLFVKWTGLRSGANVKSGVRPV